MASDFFPPGRLILAASHTKAVEEAHATSLALKHLNFQVSFDFAGLDDGLVTSASERNITVLSLWRASFKRLICSAVRTSDGFCNSPDATTMCVAGTVME